MNAELKYSRGCIEVGNGRNLKTGRILRCWFRKLDTSKTLTGNSVTLALHNGLAAYFHRITMNIYPSYEFISFHFRC
jgi:hypothetical protein